jgi:hypothetical protein
MEPIIEGTSDPLELLHYNWISLGLMFNPWVIMKVLSYCTAVVICAVMLLKCCVREDVPSRRGRSHHR